MPRDRQVRIPTMQVADIHLPPEVEKLYDMAYNLWWSWTNEARQLFSTIAGSAWSIYRNPIEMLINTDSVQWSSLVENDTFLGHCAGVVRSFEHYMDPDRETWFDRRFPDWGDGPIAYLSMEYGLHQSVRIYSGGLGVLSGDHCKSASDLGLPFVAVGLLYRFGYFRQTIDADGYQQHIYPEYDFERLPLRPAAGRRGREVVVKVPFPDREVAAKVWVAQVGRVPLLLLDTDIAENDPADRPITNLLYVRGREMRLAQEMILGVGGVRALDALGIQPAVWHINEGHSTLAQLERLRRVVVDEGLDFDAAVEAVRRNVAFTTHTPVPAGNEQFAPVLARRYLDGWATDLGTTTDRVFALGEGDHGRPDQPFNLTAFGLLTSRYANAVSELNAEVTTRMWRHLFPERGPEDEIIAPITNGVHVGTWLGLDLRHLLARHLGAAWQEKLLEPQGWEVLDEIDDDELWRTHLLQKERLGRFARARLREQYARHGRSPSELRALTGFLDPAALTIGFARRFATYKRADLLFSDLHRIRNLVSNPERPIQIVMAGKAHPADRPGQQIIEHIFKLSQEPDLKGRVIFLENYDMRMAGMLVQGVDVWLNTPRRPMEASGTSGQKAGMNGVLNCSILDGWWPEGYDGENGWAFGSVEPSHDEWHQDQADALALYGVLENEIVPTYYERDEGGLPRKWVAMMRGAIVSAGADFSASRMVRDYAERAYAPLAKDLSSGDLNSGERGSGE